jgi:hypothetical protein
MRATYALAAIAAMGISVFGVVKLSGLTRPHVEPNIIKVEKHKAPGLAISRTGPHPKAVVDENYEFGRMEVGEERSHVYTIRNEGEAPLVIQNDGTTCQCTVSDMQEGETRSVAPGGSVDIKLTWKPTQHADRFGKGAEFSTNDPEHKKISLRAQGMVAARLMIFPESDWYIASVVDDQPGVFSGAIISPIVDTFHVVAIESSSPLVSAEVLPLAKDQVEPRHGLCGYEVRVTVKPEMPLGAFRLPMTITTDVPQRNADGNLGKPTVFEVLVEGVHRGPIQLAGREWIDDKMAIALGSFEAAAGRKVTLKLFVKNPPDDGLKLTAAPVCTPETLKVEFGRDEKTKGQHMRYFLTVEYPAGSPRAMHRDADTAMIRLQTNHPRARDVEYQVLFNAY